MLSPQWSGRPSQAHDHHAVAAQLAQVVLVGGEDGDRSRLPQRDGGQGRVGGVLVPVEARILQQPDRLLGDLLVTPTPVSPDETLVNGLLASETYQAQLALLACKPPQEQIRKVLATLIDAGILPVTALAQRVGLPPTRGDGFAAVLRQLLDFDGVQVLETLPDDRTLRLHPALLRDQFELR